MPQLAPKSESWREALKFINRCPICSTNYETDRAQLFLASEAATLIHIGCPSCQSYFVAMIVMVGHGLSSVGMVTDLSFEDLTRLSQSDVLSTDEIIQGYESMNQHHFLQTLLNQSVTRV